MDRPGLSGRPSGQDATRPPGVLLQASLLAGYGADAVVWAGCGKRYREKHTFAHYPSCLLPDWAELRTLIGHISIM